MIPRLIDGDSDLLLMVPALGELAGGVEQFCGLFLSSPTHGEHRRREWIERLVIFALSLEANSILEINS